METRYINAVEIKISSKRMREDYGNIEQLAESISKYGQIQPIVINRNFELIAGGRRLAACMHAGKQPLIIFNDEANSELDIKILELEENLARKDFTPAEESAAVLEIHKIKQEQFGMPIIGGGVKGGWRIEDTAKLLNVSPARIHRHFKVVEAVNSSPGLKESKTESEIINSFKAKAKLVDAVARVIENELSIKRNVEAIVRQGDSLNLMKAIPNNSIDLLLTDPPYGIDIDKVASSIGGTTGANSTAGYSFEDSLEKAKPIYNTLATESQRFCSGSAHAVVFCAMTEFNWILEAFKNAGWLCREKPLIWIKRQTGQSNNPNIWPINTYEVALFARKPSSFLYKAPMPDHFQCDPILPGIKIHPTEKPVALLETIIKHLSIPGQVLLDPFAGSFAVIEAALKCGLNPIGIDILPEAHIHGTARISKILEVLK